MDVYVVEGLAIFQLAVCSQIWIAIKQWYQEASNGVSMKFEFYAIAIMFVEWKERTMVQQELIVKKKGGEGGFVG